MGRINHYPPEFRHEAVQLALTSGRKIREVASSLGITETTLHNWIKKHRDQQARAADPNALSEAELAELKRLRKENAQLRIDAEILRKAAAYFAKETMR